MSEPSEDSPWIETVAKAAAAVGFSEVKVRWKLRRWARSRDRRANGDEQRRLHVRYAHKTCSQCGAVNDRNDKRCNRCDAKLSARWVQVLGRLGITAPSLSATHALGLAMVVVYARTMMVSPDSGILSMDGRTLLLHGARFYAGAGIHEWWRWATSIFLHIGLWHLGFNLFALAIVGPAVEDIYGRGMGVFLFLVTGVLASAGSDLLGTPMAAGASGAVMGLIGVAAGWGQRQGTRHGKDVRNRMLVWLVYTLIFGFVIGADNWAHGVGFAAGAAFGYFVSPRSIGPAARTAAGIVGTAACAVAVVWALVGGHVPGAL